MRKRIILLLLCVVVALAVPQAAEAQAGEPCKPSAYSCGSNIECCSRVCSSISGTCSGDSTNGGCSQGYCTSTSDCGYFPWACIQGCCVYRWFIALPGALDGVEDMLNRFFGAWQKSRTDPMAPLTAPPGDVIAALGLAGTSGCGP